MKKLSWKTGLIAAVVVASGLSNAAQPGSQKIPMDGYAAIVNERIITIGDVMMSIFEAEERLRILHGGAELEAKRQELFLSGLEKLIDQALILEEFKKKSEMQIPDRLVDERVNEIIFDRFKGDRSALMSALAEDQITLEDWKLTVRERLIVSYMRRFEIGDKIVISPTQVRDAYESRIDRYEEKEKVRLRMIFSRMTDVPEEASDKINKARERIAAGEKFADVAKEVSDDSSRDIGGDWGWMEPDMLREELKTAATNVAVGAVSDVIFTPEGYYLLLVEDKKESQTKTFEEVRGDIESALREGESERLYKDWMQRLRQKYSVIYYIPAPPVKS
jgi:parvulin-like peptidyl-prolyl isomerase